MENGHSAIDRLTALAALKKYQSEPAVSTRTSTDFIKNPIVERERPREDIAEFLSNAIATTPETMPEDTEYGRALIDMLKDYGNPIINEMTLDNANLTYRREFTPSDEQKLMAKRWREHFGDEGEAKVGKGRYYDPKDDAFYRKIPRANYDRKQEIPEGWNLIDGKLKKTREKSVEKAALNIRKGDVDALLAELAHHVQYMDLTQEERDYRYQTGVSEYKKYGDSNLESRGVYGVPGTGENEAHDEIEGQLKDELKRRVDRYLFGNKSAINVEDLFKYQEGGQVLQIPQKKELDIIWPVGGENSEVINPSESEPLMAQLYWETILDGFRQFSNQKAFKDPGVSPTPRSYLGVEGYDEPHAMEEPPSTFQYILSPEQRKKGEQEIIKTFKDVQLGRGIV